MPGLCSDTGYPGNRISPSGLDYGGSDELN
jgi:hypothetical protein